MTLDGIYSPAAILKLRGFNLREKMLLSLAFNFNEKGLRVSNTELAELLDILPSRVSDLLRGLEDKGYIEIKNRQSRHRVIYFRPNPKVGEILLSSKIESKDILLSTLGHSTFEQNRNIRKKEEKRAHTSKKPQPRKTHRFTPPTVAEVKAYAESRGYPNFDAERFIEYYAVADWHDKKGEPVRNWKQKMLSQWLKPKDGQANVAETLGCGPCEEEDARRSLREGGGVLRDEL